MPESPEEKNVLTSHNYDGIQEYDNPTPGWWSWLFIATIAFAPLYLIVSATGLFSDAAVYERSVTAALMKQFAELGELSQDEATLARFVNNPAEQKWLSAGQAIFGANCIACHGSGGVGSSGPNLTDEYYLNLTDAVGIIKVINKGAKAGAMPAWENKLQPNEIVLVSAYVASLRGQNLSSARAAEGDEIPPFFQ